MVEVLRPRGLAQQRVERGPADPRWSYVADLQGTCFRCRTRDFLVPLSRPCILLILPSLASRSSSTEAWGHARERYNRLDQLSSECDRYRDQYDALDALVEALRTDSGWLEY
jgi:hypothetical protein